MKPCPKGDDCEAHAFEVLARLDGTPTVERDLTNIEAFTEMFDESFNVGVVDDVALRGF